MLAHWLGGLLCWTLQLYEGEAGEKLLERVPLGRLGETQDMGAVAAFLCSEDAAYVTGETITAAGGMTSRL